MVAIRAHKTEIGDEPGAVSGVVGHRGITEAIKCTWRCRKGSCARQEAIGPGHPITRGRKPDIGSSTIVKATCLEGTTPHG